MQTTAMPSRVNVQDKEVADLAAIPRDRRVLCHAVHEVRRNEVVNLRLRISMLPDPNTEKNVKACILSVYYVSTIKTILPPMEKNFTRSDRYGYFMYVGSNMDSANGECAMQLSVPYHAAQLVFTLMPFSIPTVRLSSAVIEIGPSVT